MTFVPGFDKDIFVSYAHVDNEALVPGEDGWVTRFHYALETRLKQILGEPVVVWRDPYLQGNEHFDETLVKRVRSAAMLLSLHTPRYLTSDWCSKELIEFMDSRSGAPDVGSYSTVFKVVKTHIDLERQHPAMQRLLGYDFYAIDDQNGRPREFSQEPREGRDARYWAKLEDLAQDMAQMLQRLRASAAVTAQPASAPLSHAPSEPPPGAASASAGGPVVFLANGTADVQPRIDSLRRELEERGCQVLPNAPLPYELEALNSTLDTLLAGCSWSIHLVGSRYGLVPEGANESLPELQVAAAERRGCRRLLWLDPARSEEDQRHGAFIARLRASGAGDEGGDLLETSFDECKATIERRILPKSHTPGAAMAGGEETVYLVYNDADADDVLTLEDALFEAGYEVVTPLGGANDDEVEADHRENMDVSDVLVLVHGQSEERWFRQTLRTVDGLLRQRPGGPLPSGVYLGPPESRDKIRFRSHRHRWLHETEAFNPAALCSLLDDILAERAT